MKKLLLLAVLALATAGSTFLVAPGASADTISFSDTFEAATIDPFWTVREEFGTVGVSSDQAHSGSQAVKFSSTSGGQRNIGLRHQFPDVMKGSVSVWFYDTAQNTLWAGLDIFNTTIPWGEPGFRFHAIVADFGPLRYRAGDGTFALTPSVRTAGWHEFKIVYNSADVQIFIDGTQVGSFAGDFGFDSIGIGMWGPSWRPDGTFYWDDFNVEEAWVEVDIDIKPGSDPNCIKLTSKGRLPVAVLGNSVDVTTIDAGTIEIDDDDDPATTGVAPVRASFKDVDGDSEPDLVLHFRTPALNAAGLLVDGNELFITGELTDGTPIVGSDTIFLAGWPNCFD